jgi:hypothetical protein
MLAFLAFLYAASVYVDTEAIEVFVVGALLGWILTSFLARPSGRFVLVVPEDLSRARLLWIPEEHFSLYDSPQSPTCITTMLGHPLYIATGFDQAARRIEYGWIHEDLPVRVAADRANYLAWYKRAESAMIDNLRLRNYPLIHGAGLAKGPVDEVASWIGERLGFGSAGEREPFRSDILKEACDEAAADPSEPLVSDGGEGGSDV